MQIKVTTKGPVDFVDTWYVFPVDLTCSAGAPCMPYAINGTQNNDWLNWDFALVVGQPSGASSVQTELVQFITEPNTTIKVPAIVQNYAPGLELTVANCGSRNQFCVTFLRRIFNGIEPGPTPSPSGPAGNWYINFLAVAPQASFNQNNPVGQVIFAPGFGGLNDQTFTFPVNTPGLDVATQFDQTLYAPPSPPWMTAPNASAQLTQFEVSNYP